MSKHERVFVIAEAGVNHNGSIETAEALVDAAAAAGADAVKFQTFAAAELATSSAKQAEYQVRATGEQIGQRRMLERLELDESAHRRLIARAAERGVSFLSSPFSVSDVEMLVRLGLQTMKIPSGQITEMPYLRKIGSLGGEVIMSTGMADLGEVGAALAVLEESGTQRDKVTLLHCSTEYPAPYEDVNLRAMITLAQAFGTHVGYSDHTEGIEVAVAAVALGASVIEKHLTLDRTMAGPDHAASVEPDVLAEMVSAIRNTETALGVPEKRPVASELAIREIVRKSIVASRPIRAGEPFGPDNLSTKRPGTGISPMRWDDVIGRLAPRAFETDEMIEL